MHSSSHVVVDHSQCTLEEECFLGLLQEDLAVFLSRTTLNRVLVFPPLSSRLRFLIHKVVEGSSTLASHSIGKEPKRRTLVYFAKKSFIERYKGSRNGQYMSSSQETPCGHLTEYGLAGKGRGRGRGRGLGRGQRVLSKECSPDNSPNAARRPARTLYKPGAFRKLKSDNGGNTGGTPNAVQSSLSNEKRGLGNPVEKSLVKSKPPKVEKCLSHNIKDNVVNQFNVGKEMVQKSVGKGNVIRQTKPMSSLQNADTCNSAYSGATGHDVCSMDNSGSTDPVEGLIEDNSGFTKVVDGLSDNSGSTNYPIDGPTNNGGYLKAATHKNADTCNSAYSGATGHDVCSMDDGGPTDPVDGPTNNSGYSKAATLENADTCNSAYSGATGHDVCSMDNSGSTDPVEGLIEDNSGFTKVVDGLSDNSGSTNYPIDGPTNNGGYLKAATLKNADTCNSAYSGATGHDVCSMDDSGSTDPVDGSTNNSGYSKAATLKNADTCNSAYSGATDHDVCSMDTSGSTDPVEGLIEDNSGFTKVVDGLSDNSGSTNYPIDGPTNNSGYPKTVTFQNADTCNSAYSGATDHDVCSMGNSGSTDPVEGLIEDNNGFTKVADGLADNSGSTDLAIAHNENTGFTDCVIGLTDKSNPTNHVNPTTNRHSADPVVGSTSNSGSNVIGVDPSGDSSTHHVDFTDSNSSTDHVNSTDGRGSTNHGVVSTGNSDPTDPAVGHYDNCNFTDSAGLDATDKSGSTDSNGSFDHIVGSTDNNGFVYPTDPAVDHAESLIELDKRNSGENKLIDASTTNIRSSESGASGQDPDFEEMMRLKEAMNVKTTLKEEEFKGHKDLADKINTSCTDRNDLRTDVLQKEAGTSENITDNYGTQHKSKRQCKKDEKAKKKEGKLKKKSKTPLKSDTKALKKDVGDCVAVEGKTAMQCGRKENRENDKNEEINVEKREEKTRMEEEGSGEDWETSWGENGECLNAEILAELNEIVDEPDIEIVKPQFDYLSFKPKDIVLNSGVFDHVVELYDFSPDLKSPELIHALSKFKSQGFEIVWVDDTHALAVFSNHKIAQSAIEECSSPMLKLRSLYDGTQASKLKARRNVDNLQPYKERPKTSKLIANRLVTGALGLRSKMSKEERQLEREKIKAERERKLNKEKQKKDLWESNDLQN